jgi:hypothetical protein
MIDVVGDFTICKLKTLQRVETNVYHYAKHGDNRGEESFLFILSNMLLKGQVTPCEMLTC